MALKAVVKALTEVPEALRGEYKEVGGNFVLDLDGDHPVADGLKIKVAEFRDTNIKLMKELDETKSKWDKVKDVDADEYQRLKAEAKKLETKGVKTSDDISTVIAKALAEGMEPLRKDLERYKTESAAKDRALNTARLKEVVGAAITNAGAKSPAAVEFLLSKAASLFHVVDGDVRAQDGKFSYNDPTQPLKVDEWVTRAAKEYDFAFEKSSGGGAEGSTQFGGVQLKPGQKPLLDPTPRQLGEFASEIASGKVVVLRSAK